MDFFASGLNALRGQKGQHQTGSEAVDRLCERIEHATLLEDRRAAVLGLKACSREHKRDIGSRGVLVLCKVLQQDTMDIDICKAVLETLTVLCQPDADREEAGEFAVEMSNAVLQNANNVTILLDMLEENDFYVRFHVVSLLSTLVLNNTPRLQECILTSPMGMSRLMALLDDRREIIRNEGLLLIISLTESNADLQKIVAFENAFERLLAIIDDEGAIAGGIIVQDCLQLVQNLLRYNVSNQNYFRETSCIQRIPALFEEPLDESGRSDPSLKDQWSDQKGNNMIMVLELIRVLVVPDHSNTGPNQVRIHQRLTVVRPYQNDLLAHQSSRGILQLLIDLSLTSTAPQRVKASAFYALAELIRQNKVNQDFLSKAIIIPAHPPSVPSEEPSLSLIPPTRSSAQFSRSSFQSGRNSALGNRGSHSRPLDPRERCPAIVESFVLENPDTQMVLATTLNAPPEDNPNSAASEKPQTPGTLLLGALQGWQDDSESGATDPYNSWFATVLFSHILQNNARAKSIALAITFGDEENGEDPVSLIHAIAAALMVAVKGRADLIELISPSSKEDPMAQGLAAFLLGICYEFNWEEDALITRATIQPIILSRIGLDHFAACITRVRESKPFNAAAPFMVVLPSEEGDGKLPSLFFDYAFVEFMKRTFERTQKSIALSPDSTSSAQTFSQTGHAEMESQMSSLQSKLSKQSAEMAQLRSQLEGAQLMLAQQASLLCFLFFYHQEQHDYRVVYMFLVFTLLLIMAQERQQYEATVAGLQQEIRERQERHEALEREHEDLLICLAEQDEELTGLKNQLRGLGLEAGGGFM
ncbi:hypothetical protein EDD11_003944 [Mortierella claussenii]|nr:hypothetical protein EDD11_003944 [Mortierella claussenii]